MSRPRILLIALVALTIAGLACSAATPTPTPTPIPTATEPPEATATSAPTPKPAATSTRAAAAATSTRAVAAAPTTAPSSAGVLFNDDFSSQTATEDNGWELVGSANVDRTWSANKYTLTVKKKGQLGFGTPDGEYTDFGAEIEAQANSAYAKYGIRFRSQGSDNPSYYIFVVTTDGKY
jgi:hypothetical protein